MQEFVELTAGRFFYVGSRSFWVRTKTPGEDVARGLAGLGYLSNGLRGMLKASSDGSAFFGLAEPEKDNVFGIPSSKLVAFDRLIQTLGSNPFDSTHQTILISLAKEPRERSFVVTQGASPADEFQRLLGLVLAYRTREVYVGGVGDSIVRFILPPMNAKADDRGVTINSTQLSCVIVPVISVWSPIGYEERHQADLEERSRMITLTLVAIFAMKDGDLKLGRLPDFLERFGRRFHQGTPVQLTSSNDNAILRVARNEKVTFVKLIQSFAESVGGLFHEEKLDARKLERTSMTAVVVGDIRLNGQRVPIPDFRTKKSLNADSSDTAMAIAGGRFTWTISSDNPAMGLEELLESSKMNQIWREHNLVEFVGSRSRVVVSFGNFDESFLDGPSYWVLLAGKMLLSENISAQLGLVHGYNELIEQKTTKTGYNEMMLLRRREIEDLEQLYNLETTGYFFRDQVDAIQGSVGIKRMNAILKEKISELSSLVFVEKQTISSDMINLLTLGLMPITFLLGASAFLMAFYTSQQYFGYLVLASAFLIGALLILVFVMYRALVIQRAEKA